MAARSSASWMVLGRSGGEGGRFDIGASRAGRMGRWEAAARHPDQREALLAGFRLRERLGVEEIAVDHNAVVDLALETGLTAYDASYLWLAKQLAADLITLDNQLDKAATAG
jgi:predicted nucleic acid-binding protein